MSIHRTKSLHRTAVTATVALAAAAGLIGLAAPASAAAKPDPSVGASVPTNAPAKPASRAGKDGVCQSGELCMYYLQQRQSHLFDLFVSDVNFSGDVFPGTGISADNNVRSYINNDTFYWRVYSGANYSGTEILCIAPGDRGNFSRRDWDTASSANYSSTAC